MPINRNGKHWCDPASETPNKLGNWKCPDCSTTWHWWPEHSSWAVKGEDLDELLKVPETPAEEIDEKEGDQ